MNSTASRGGRRGTVGVAATIAAFLMVGVIALAIGVRGSDGPPQPAAAAPPAVTTTTAGAPMTKPRHPTTRRARTSPKPAPQANFGPFLSASAPVVLDIPSIGVHSSSFVDLQVGSDGSLDVPGTAKEVGFYTGGPTPGQLGPAVMGAHVDSVKGPGVFYRLGAVKRGEKVHVSRRDGTVVTFVVDKVAVYPKDHFPTEQVYRGDFTRSEIRLITCGGTFDPVKHYLANVIVFAHLTGVA